MPRSAILLAALWITSAQDLSRRPSTPSPLSRVSSVSPYPRGCVAQQSGTDYRDAAVEPSIAADPTNPQHLIGVWQQNRWSNGAADGILTAVSLDGGLTWTNTYAAFSQCTGGFYARASDPWVTISPNGIAFQSALAVDANVTPIGVLVSRSTDGGFSWTTPVTVDANAGDDKETITADPTDSNYVYLTWDRTAGTSEPAIFARTSDGGATWEPAQQIVSPASQGYACCNQTVVLPNATLVHVFVAGVGASQGSIEVSRSPDHGTTWTGASFVSTDDAIGVVDSRTQTPIRAGGGIPSTAVDPNSGVIYIAWEDARFSQNLREGIVFLKSLDGGLTWTYPAQVNQVPQVQAFTPTVAVNASGAVAITYYDFRQATNDTSTLPTNYWQIVSSDGGNTWQETPVAGPFDIQRAAQSGTTYFLGDYQALAASGNNFIPFFVATNPAPSPIPSSMFALPQPRTGSTAWNGRVEINHHPRPLSARIGPKKHH